MGRLKGKLAISDRDKKLLVYVFAILIVFLAYFVGYQKLSADLETSQKQVVELTKKKKDLTAKNNNRAQYESDTANYKNENVKLLDEFGTGLSQPEAIAFLNKVENITGVWIKSVSFAQPTAIYTFGAKASSNPSATDKTAYNTDMVGYKTTLNLAYEGDYEQWNTLMSYINTYQTKNTIDSISASYSETSDTVSGAITVSMYYITGKDREFTEPVFDVKTGTDNIFDNK